MVNTQNHDYCLDMIRCFAIWMIFTYHFCVSNQLTDSAFCGYKNGGWGSVGTAIFFMLSGYCMNLNNYHFSNRKDWLCFYKKRFFSLFPIMWITFAIFYLIKAFFFDGFLYGGSLWKILLSFMGIDAYLGFWGIQTYYVCGEWFTAIIILIYLLYPVLFYLFNKFKCITTIILIILYFSNIFWGKFSVPPDATIFTGVLLFWVGMIIQNNITWIRNKKNIFIPVCIVMILIVIFIPLPYYNSTLPWKNLLAMGIFLLLLITLNRLNLKKEIIKKLLLFESRVCYAIYLCHHVLISWIPIVCERIGIVCSNTITNYFVILICVQIIASVLFIFDRKINKYFIRYLSKSLIEH